MASATVMGPPPGWTQNQQTSTHAADPACNFNPSDGNSRYYSCGWWGRRRRHPPCEGSDFNTDQASIPSSPNNQTTRSRNEQAYCPKTRQYWGPPVHSKKQTEKFEPEAGDNKASNNNNGTPQAGFPNNAEQFREQSKGYSFWQHPSKRTDEFSSDADQNGQATSTDEENKNNFSRRHYGDPRFFYHPGMRGGGPWERRPDAAQWQGEGRNSASTSTPEPPNNQAVHDKKEQTYFSGAEQYGGPPPEYFDQYMRRRVEEFSPAAGQNHDAPPNNNKQTSELPNNAGQPDSFHFWQGPSKRPDEFSPGVGQNNQSTISGSDEQMFFSGRRHGNPGFWHPDMRRVPWEGRPEMAQQWAEAGGYFSSRGGMHGHYGNRHPGFHRGVFNRGGPENGALFREFDFF